MTNLTAEYYTVTIIYLFLNTALEFPCRGNSNFAISMCNSQVQWAIEKLGDGSDASCVSKVTGKACDIKSAKYKGVCSKAPSAKCPNKLMALINAWIQLSKSRRFRK